MIFLTNGAATTGHSHTKKKNESRHRHYTLLKMNHKTKCKTIKLLEDNIGETLDDLGMMTTF